ncbi:hypothetical protein EVAR_94963_1 [Eumeta japonica]|uniref:Uncharacterized protein n=1 Tax=Eumeta variegata TaxID=151549 RepID=A0A4C1UV60_EUMVA|nr:hypothetical protein EVAR_94963_1 [Eumeta japonica]
MDGHVQETSLTVALTYNRTTVKKVIEIYASSVVPDRLARRVTALRWISRLMRVGNREFEFLVKIDLSRLSYCRGAHCDNLSSISNS